MSRRLVIIRLVEIKYGLLIMFIKLLLMKEYHVTILSTIVQIDE